MPILLLIRHATNDWVGGRLAGWTPGVCLNEEGKRQAQHLAERLHDVPLAAVYASPLERAVETAQFIATPHNVHVQTCEAIGEVHYGDWNGAELKQLRTHELWPSVQCYPSGTRFPKGETLGEVQMRAVAGIDDLLRQHTETERIAVVSHADVIKLAVAYYVGMHIDLFQRLVIDPASLTVVAFQPMGPRLVLLNDTSTLNCLRLTKGES